jgi:hypothetical protein
MSDEKKGKPAKSVMGNLPSTRPTRMARRRDGEPAANGTAEPKPAAAERAAAGASPKQRQAKRKPAAKPRRATPKAVGKPATKAGQKAKPKVAADAAAPKPRAVRSGSPSLDAAKKPRRTPRRRPAPTPPKGAELVTTAVQATGELAKIGLTLGGQAIKRAVDRLPKP